MTAAINGRRYLITLAATLGSLLAAEPLRGGARSAPTSCDNFAAAGDRDDGRPARRAVPAGSDET